MTHASDYHARCWIENKPTEELQAKLAELQAERTDRITWTQDHRRAKPFDVGVLYWIDALKEVIEARKDPSFDPEAWRRNR
jgi:hypothetical protein